MSIQVEVPQVGESITEGVLVEWLKQDGDIVATDDPLFTLETDKVTMTINAEHAGRLKTLVAAGETVQIGQVVGEIDPDAKAESEASRVGPADLRACLASNRRSRSGSGEACPRRPRGAGSLGATARARAQPRPGSDQGFGARWTHHEGRRRCPSRQELGTAAAKASRAASTNTASTEAATTEEAGSGQGAGRP